MGNWKPLQLIALLICLPVLAQLEQPSIQQIRGNVLWLEARMQGAASGDTLAEWTDKSGKGNNFAQGAAANRPTYLAGQTNALVFDSTDRMTNSAVFGNCINGAGALTLCFVVRLPAYTGTSATDNLLMEGRHAANTSLLMNIRGDSGQERAISFGGRSVATDGYQLVTSTARAIYSEVPMCIWGIWDYANSRIITRIGDAVATTNAVTFGNTTYTYGSEQFPLTIFQNGAGSSTRTTVLCYGVYGWTNFLTTTQQDQFANYARARMQVLPDQARVMQSGGRLDTAAYAGNDILLTGSRNPNAGYIYRSTNSGVTWTSLGQVVGNNSINNMQSDGAGNCWLVTSNTTVWRSTDYGSNWYSLGLVTNITAETAAAKSYWLQLTPTSILMPTTKSDGGNIMRSTDSGTNWTCTAVLGSRGIYRMVPATNGYIAYGWDGHAYKTSAASDGVAWADLGAVSATQLWSSETCGNGIILLGDNNGVIWRSVDDGTNWTSMGDIGADCDDLVYLGNGVVLSSITSDVNIQRSTDYGQTWAYADRMGTMGTDWPDHMIAWTDIRGRKFAALMSNLGYFRRLRGIGTSFAK